MDKPFGWAVVGAGAIARTIAKEITREKRHRIVSVFSRTYERSVEFAKRYNAVAYRTLDEALLAEGVEGVYIASPHTAHMEGVLRALELSVPVLVEKPITMNARELERIISAKGDTYVSEAMWTRYNPITRDIRALVASGALGKIESVRAEFSYPYSLSGFSDRVVKKEYGGGALLDIGVYVVSYMDMLLGAPATIMAKSKIGKYGTDKTTIMHFGYDSNEGMETELVASLERLSLCTFRLRAEHGSISMPLFYRPTRAHIEVDGERRTLRCKAGYIHEFDEVSREIREGRSESSLMPLCDSLSVMRTLDKVRDMVGLRYPSDED